MAWNYYSLTYGGIEFTFMYQVVDWYPQLHYWTKFQLSIRHKRTNPDWTALAKEWLSACSSLKIWFHVSILFTYTVSTQSFKLVINFFSPHGRLFWGSCGILCSVSFTCHYQKDEINYIGKVAHTVDKYTLSQALKHWFVCSEAL